MGFQSKVTATRGGKVAIKTARSIGSPGIMIMISRDKKDSYPHLL